VFALVDCNSFYASCERLFRPDLANVPIVVLSNNDGCIIALCDKAKKLGVPMGAPYFKISNELKRNNISVFSSNYTLYGDLSKRVMLTLESLADRVEVYSIDEAFLDLANLSSLEYQSFGVEARTKVLKNVGIPTCVGIAPTKTLAKMANRVAKKFKEKTEGVWVLDTPEKIDKCLRWVDVEDIWGIGRKSARKLNELGVFKACDFVKLSDGLVQKTLSIVGLRIKKELLGQSCLPLELISPPKKSIITSRSFGKPARDIDTLESAVTFFATRCAEKLRSQRLVARYLSVFIETNRFKVDSQQYFKRMKHTFVVPTNDVFEIVKYALKLLKAIHREGYQYKKAGVMVLENIPSNEVQCSLFDEVDRERNQKVISAIDTANSRFGEDIIHFGVLHNQNDWKLNRKYLSPSYTTRWSDLISIS
jgi:DNA polymerase V